MSVIPQVIVPSNPVDQQTIFDAIKEADNSFFRIEAEKDQIKAIIEDLNEKFPDLGKKYIRKMMTTYHKQNFDKVAAEMDDFETLYTSIVK